MNGVTDISVVIPVYGSCQSLEELCSRLLTSLDRYNFEIIMVDDSSPDNSWHVIESLVQRHKG
jgi:glycosyltransferase involved in cell wall biosynthesis